MNFYVYYNKYLRGGVYNQSGPCFCMPDLQQYFLLSGQKRLSNSCISNFYLISTRYKLRFSVKMIQEFRQKRY